ncbi:hypothetical protein AMQ84_00775 [Paenibacillus riograndensis]|uniref:Diacylglycerol glucosyltransferase N-terminal domain-containing protein n=1 Tax=Paenibacillus riograndensis TaxID=483937 RepID=A0A132UBW9_9BACL|nr:glycosyltransferase [Paenibacillus riograndensis]KWX81159.1 hypothetical protein AMQ84_00775 [Paenibacillus riograndensis]
MKVAILAANTGQGHISVMNSICSYLENNNIYVECFGDFYEQLMPSNKVLSDFYNLLQITSLETCRVYTQMSLLENKDKFDELYSYWYEPLNHFFRKYSCDVIVSTTPLINKYIIRYLKEVKSSRKFYIVVTDPFIPMYPGFAVQGADCYFCPNIETRALLETEGILPEKIIVSGYPLHKKFDAVRNDMLEFNKQYYLHSGKPTILINCGAQGSMDYLSIVKRIHVDFREKANAIVLCGNNSSLYAICKNKYPDFIILKYVDNVQDLLKISDLCITKAGANTFYECLYTDTPILVNGVKGFLYQEEGVIQFMEEYRVGKIFLDLEELNLKLNEMIEMETLNIMRGNIENLNIVNGSIKIAEVISQSGVRQKT